MSAPTAADVDELFSYEIALSDELEELQADFAAACRMPHAHAWQADLDLAITATRRELRDVRHQISVNDFPHLEADVNTPERSVAA